MEKCFVMQPFDGATFDKRYEDIFVPAIRDAGLDPYRVDQDPKVTIPIQDIENGIRDSRICLADITLDNPNVWFELGYAFASGKEVVLVCSDERKTHFPFDVQHRTIIKYSTGAPRDFEQLKDRITERIKAILQKAETLSNISEVTMLAKFEGLEHHEVMALAVIAGSLESPMDGVTAYQFHRDMEAHGFTKIASNLALKHLVQMEYIYSSQFSVYDTNELYWGYSLKDEGWDWVLANTKQFVLRKETTGEDKPF